ncbi:hypothetical protein HPB52_013044 [Rhipicephalus sanguineus]|uniref:Uncharacterized protein n=1 Tax=Rhipicephalus sanguineus TaxID=34632 RepID=A0A9D4PFY6_RHISA|nr:hypothetical protein HPB52_013044 [Rhipicephalus sanguineus]
MPPYAYVCTVAEPVRNTPQGLRLFLPPESTCDYIFYDSLYKDGKNNLLGGLDKLDRGVQSFISVAPKRNRSQLGFSFALEPLFMREFKDRLFPKFLDVIWNYKIHHFGFLNLYRQYADAAMVTEALNALKTMYHYLMPKATSATPSYYVIGVSLDDITARAAIVNLMRTVFGPSMFIAISHITYPLRTFSDCRIFPLAMEDLPEGLTRGRDYTYGHTVSYEVDLTAKARTRRSLFGYEALWSFNRFEVCRALWKGVAVPSPTFLNVVLCHLQAQGRLWTPD